MRKYMFITLFALASIIYAQTGLFTGKIIDENTKEPLIGVNILILELENIGTASDLNGNFILTVPVGSYSAKISLIGYTSNIRTDISIKTQSETYIDVQLSASSVELNEVKVTADYFDKAIIENNLSTIALGVEEVRRSPGSMGDFQRILQGIA